MASRGVQPRGARVDPCREARPRVRMSGAMISKAQEPQEQVVRGERG